MSEIISEISKNIAFYRNEKGMTQKELGDAIGTTGNTISNWEKRVSRVDIISLIKICMVLDISLNDMAKNILKTKSDAITITTEPEKTIVNKFLQLTERNKYKIEGKIEDCLEEQQNKIIITSTECANELTPTDQELEAEADEFAALAKEQFYGEKRQASQASIAKESGAG